MSVLRYKLHVGNTEHASKIHAAVAFSPNYKHTASTSLPSVPYHSLYVHAWMLCLHIKTQRSDHIITTTTNTTTVMRTARFCRFHSGFVFFGFFALRLRLWYLLHSLWRDASTVATSTDTSATWNQRYVSYSDVTNKQNKHTLITHTYAVFCTKCVKMTSMYMSM